MVWCAVMVGDGGGASLGGVVSEIGVGGVVMEWLLIG